MPHLVRPIFDTGMGFEEITGRDRSSGRDVRGEESSSPRARGRGGVGALRFPRAGGAREYRALPLEIVCRTKAQLSSAAGLAASQVAPLAFTDHVRQWFI